ncbi:type IX secretion system periplasmic lipoprotein PorW/SprE [Arachidicoccus ginsenosidivorans]
MAKANVDSGRNRQFNKRPASQLFIGVIMILVLLSSSTHLLYGQAGTTINLRDVKPAEFAKKLLRAEKTDYGPLGKFQQFMQNTFTRFNYLYNANQRLKEIVDKATEDYKEDYTQLLSYYPYDSKAMAANSYLDSVIQHATAGILLHDLRNQYVDELYFLLGKAYYYQKKYDTAHQVFQYLNYAFAPKDDGYDLPIGSNISKVKNQFTILNPEHKGISKNSYARKERRNDGLIWQVKNYIQSGDFIQARVLLGYIEKDSLLPKRLIPLVAQTHGFLFYKLKAYDSAANYLVKTDFQLYKRAVRPRMYYLTGQLYALGGDSLRAADYFGKAKSSAIDPLLSIYSALAEASMSRRDLVEQMSLSAGSNKKEMAGSHMALLEKLSRKDKFRRYKDVIYYAEAAIALKKQDNKLGRDLLLSSIKAGKKITPPNNWQKSRTYFALAGLDYDKNSFYEAAKNYDSVNSADLTRQTDRKLLDNRKSPLNQVAGLLDSIYFQDSLQHLAAMPEKARLQLLKEKAKEIRKAIQQKAEAQQGDILNPAVRRPVNQAPTSLFPSSGATSTTWYFNNPTLKNSGYQLFKQKFGNRPNVDNWQRISAITGRGAKPIKSALGNELLAGFNPDGSIKLDSSNIQAEDLLQGLPLTDSSLKISNHQIAAHLFHAGLILQNTMENFTGAIYVYDSLMRRFPSWDSTDQVLFNEFICWTLLGKKNQADMVKTQLTKAYPASKWLAKINRQDSLQNNIPETSLQNKATYAYNQVYQLFLAGDFNKADSLKQIADRQYGRFYWTAQLLYIESVYYIDAHKDSIAEGKLEYLIKNFNTSPVRPQAQHLLSILKRRSEIQAYLRQLHILPTGQIQNSRLSRLESAAAGLAEQRERRIAILRNQKILDLPDSANTPINQLEGELNRQSAQIGIREAVKPVNELIDSTKLAVTTENNPAVENRRPDTTQINKQPNHAVSLPPISANPDKQVRSAQPTDSSTNSQATDSAANNQAVQPPPTVTQPVSAPPQANNLKQTATINGFTFNPAQPQYVTVILHHVAPVFASEAANAFNRYNLLAFEHDKWPVNRQQSIPETDLVQIGPFKDYKAAEAYLKQIQPVAPSTILPWLAPDKFELIIVSPQNTNKLKSKEDLKNYQEAWKQFEAK